MGETTCLFCNGTGRDVCSACEGKGKVGGLLGFGARTCPNCEGSGEAVCEHCRGSGRERTQEH